MERKSGVMPIHLSDTAKKDLSLRGALRMRSAQAPRRSNPTQGVIPNGVRNLKGLLHFVRNDREALDRFASARNDNLFWRRRLAL